MLFQLWRGELKRSQQRQKIALRRALLYRWRVWRAYLRQYKTVEMEDMGVELDRKLESLERLQVLLQNHASPKNATGTTPKNRDQSASQNLLLATVEERSEITETLTSSSFLKDTGALASAGSSDGGDAGESVSAKRNSIPLEAAPEVASASPKETKPKKNEETGLRRSGTSEKVVSWDIDAQKVKVPVVKLSTREQKRADEDRLLLRKSMFGKVNESIRTTLSSLALPPPIEVRYCAFFSLHITLHRVLIEVICNVFNSFTCF